MCCSSFVWRKNTFNDSENETLFSRNCSSVFHGQKNNQSCNIRLFWLIKNWQGISFLISSLRFLYFFNEENCVFIY
uniref:Uncharacterized protein n=1 Tax=Lepeophtheirus salmonis TaxID=72036 RepID=A0A0K2UDG5_LEPSM